MKVVQFSILLSIYVILAVSEHSHESSEVVPPPPSPIVVETTDFDPDNCTIDPPPTDAELTAYFEWMDAHNKNWRNAVQRKCKLVRVIHNMRDINAHNQRYREGKETYERALWDGSEFTEEEKIKHYVGAMIPAAVQTRALPANFLNLPPPLPSVDYRDKGWISLPITQNGCGSCWAIAAITPLEAQVRKCGITNETLSIQSMIDCCTVGCWGCQSGWPQ